jgi:hypothetical protein
MKLPLEGLEGCFDEEQPARDRTVKIAERPAVQMKLVEDLNGIDIRFRTKITDG